MQHNHHYLLWLYIQGYGSHSFRRLVLSGLKRPVKMSHTAEELDRGADALRQHEQGGKRLRDWIDLPAATKKKWREKASIVLAAAGSLPMTQG